MNILAHPKWQYPLRESQKALGRSPWAEETLEDGIERMQGAKLYLVLKTFFSLPIPKGTVQRNYYTADGIWFRLKFGVNDVAADGNPLYEATHAVSGHHKTPSKASMTFTLYVGHVTPDESYLNWPQPKALVARELGLSFTNYMPVQAELALLIDQVEAEYQAALSSYLAWRDLERMPSDAAMQTDYLRQLVRQALRRMPAAELLKTIEPVVIPEADAADEAAKLDGMKLPAPDEEFDGYDAFDPNDTPDDMSDDEDDPDDDDGFDPDNFDETGTHYSPEPESPINIDAPGYETQRIPGGADISEADLKGVEYPYPVS